MASSLILPFFSVFATLFFFFFLSFNCSASIHLSAAIAAEQAKFWSKNVQNKMPEPILKKLSPLSQTDSDYYSRMMMSEKDKFSADANFCSLAKLACTSIFDNVKTVTQTYTTVKTYGAPKPAGLKHVKKNEDPFSFFRLSILKKGNLVHLPNLKESLPDRAFLPPQIASRVSLTSDGITNMFPESASGATRETIETTLSYCNAAAIGGEIKSCPKSMEEMIGFVEHTLGGKKLLAMTSKITKDSGDALMISKIKKFNAKKTVACHEAFLPFAFYFCHSLSSTSLYQVDFVEPKTGGAPINTMLGICHMDTSTWPANHVAFEMLKFHPGQGEACHWFTKLDLAWIASGEPM